MLKVCLWILPRCQCFSLDLKKKYLKTCLGLLHFLFFNSAPFLLPESDICEKNNNQTRILSETVHRHDSTNIQFVFG
jgi:hypothetical protein